ncbi:hypothetical protein GPECTOR_32g444 [Gonium pectorale]|uniref:Uncharacterized protein n=1 Tax=Gonium pectorale TaxID=33097 RepID=A0A150GDB7_GONPE|nr:hypothetical protein GPECTOR_32g444 [Gonium pectorale]|eukprot:KXZ47832.1 hypothetical protein GPECTOR_32g444 [Gonium pectorale]
MSTTSRLVPRMGAIGPTAPRPSASRPRPLLLGRPSWRPAPRPSLLSTRAGAGSEDAAATAVAAADAAPASASAASAAFTPLPLSPATGGAPVRPGSGYKLPPPEIAAIVDAPSQPGLSYSPDRKLFLQLQRPPSLPPIFEMARPELKLGGLRLDPELYARSKMGYNTGRGGRARGRWAGGRW